MSSENVDATAPSAVHPEHRHLVQEVTTMALYVSLSLLAVLLALPIGLDDNRVRAGFTVLATGVGLVLAHHLAYRMSSRLVNGGLLTPASVEALKAQALGGLPVALLASLPVFVLGESPGEEVAEVVLIAFVALVGYRAARYSSSVGRSILYVAAVVVVVAVVLGIKLLAGGH